ncbi:MAG: hypothetical protein J5965_11480, partial [Aeriscardovia sp.]|nr:hypothetical protein [Aeriscardovia sp.]
DLWLIHTVMQVTRFFHERLSLLTCCDTHPHHKRRYSSSSANISSNQVLFDFRVICDGGMK